MRILLAASEVVPFAKTGGLADVCGALPRALGRSGHQVAVILPAYREALSSAERIGLPIEPLGIDFVVPVGNRQVRGSLSKSKLPHSDVPVYFVCQDDYYDRDALYGEEDGDYADNCARFIFFSRAVLEAVRLLDLDLDVIHCNDWQTGLVPALLEIEYRKTPRYQPIASLFSLHNLAYQGTFWHWDMLLTCLDWKYFNWHQMECYGRLNLLKTGLVFADAISTVSRRYAEEIQTPQFGHNLDSVLRHRRNDLHGILNGIDTQVWDPSADEHLSAHYSAETVDPGKQACKAALQEEMGLPDEPDVPLIGIVGRFVDQKGFDLVADILPDWLASRAVQWVVLGTGDQPYKNRADEPANKPETLANRFKVLAKQHPDKLAARIEFSERLAHRIEAGSDLLLMPSRFEPCGLSQMVSLRYGTVPLVHHTGGLADTIVDATERTLADGTANGFSFFEDRAEALAETLERVIEAFGRPEVWSHLARTGMRQDWSWGHSAQEYVALYERLSATRRAGAVAELARVQT